VSTRQLRRGNWSVQELERLRLLLPRRGVDQTAALLRRSPTSVQKKALDLLRVPQRRGDWTDSDDQQLRQAWGAVEPRLLGPMLGRPTSEVRRRAAELRARTRSGPWSRDELKLLKALYGTRRDGDLEVCLQRAAQDIADAAGRLCLAKDKRFTVDDARTRSARGRPRSRMPRWSAAETERLRQIYPDLDNLAVARELGRTVTSVANKANQLGLRKSRALLADIGRTNIELRHRRPRNSAVGGA
jgi:hypothetical protein